MTSPYGPAANPLGLANPMFKLEYPQSLGTYSSYADAQKAVDSLADQNFPVSNLAIVGTDLKLIERVTGRKTWGTVLSQGVLQGLSTALMVALILLVLNPSRDVIGILGSALFVGILIGVGFAALGHALGRGQRDFTSVSQTVPSKFEILCEHKVAVQARELLAKSPQSRAAAFDPARQAPQPGQYPPGAYGSYGQAQPGYPPAPAGQYPVSAEGQVPQAQPGTYPPGSYQAAYPTGGYPGQLGTYQAGAYQSGAYQPGQADAYQPEAYQAAAYQAGQPGGFQQPADPYASPQPGQVPAGPEAGQFPAGSYPAQPSGQAAEPPVGPTPEAQTPPERQQG